MIRRFLSYANSFVPKDRAAGIDGAHWWGWFHPEEATKPIDFIVIKATQDDRWTDPLFDANAFGASKIDIRGAYHYQKLFVSWLTQAEHFLRVAGQYDFHIYALDVEKINNESAFTIQRHGDMFVSDMRRIIDHWRTKAPTKSVWLYTNWDIYQSLIYPTIKRLYGAEGLQWLDNLPLWLAVYNGLGPHGEPSLPAGRKTWEVWQYSDRGRKEDYGTNGAVDLNVYKGTKAEMLLWLGLTDPGEPDPPPPPEPPTGETMPNQTGTINTSERYIRNGAGVSNTHIATLYRNDTVIIDDTEPVGGYDWYHIIDARHNNQPVITLGGLTVNQRQDCWIYGESVVLSPVPPTPAPSLPVLNVKVSGEGYETVIVELRPE